MINPLTSVILIIILYLFFQPDRLLIDSDTGWHLMAGKYIVNHGAIPYDNVFSYDTGNYHWLNISWLWDVIFGFIYSHGGLYATVSATIFVIAITIALTAYICFYRGGGIISTGEIFIFSMFTYFASAMVRPHIMTYFFTALTLLLCYKLKLQKRSWPLFLLPIIMVIWVNMHGGFIVGLSIILSFAGEMILKKSYPHRLKLVLSCAACVASVLVNPLGIEIFDGINRSLSGPMAKHINEWQITKEFVHYLYICLFVIVYVIRRKNFSLAETVLSFFWLVQSILSFRNLPIFTIIAAPALASAIHQLVMSWPKVAAKERTYAADFKLKRFAAVMVVVFIICSSSLWTRIIQYTPNKVLNYPSKEVEFAVTNYPNNRFFNNYDLGGFIILLSDGKLKTFVDGRAETGFPNDVLLDYLKFHTQQKDWIQIFDKYKINGILIAKYQGAQIDEIEKHKEWRKVFTGDKALVFVR